MVYVVESEPDSEDAAMEREILRATKARADSGKVDNDG